MSTESDALLDSRTSRVLDLFSDLSLDHMLLTVADNIRYATNFRSLIIQETADHMVCLMARDGRAEMFGPHVREAVSLAADETVAVEAVRPIAGWAPLLCDVPAVVRIFSAELAAAGARRVGYDVLHPVILDGLQSALPSTEFIYAGDGFFDLRRQKLDTELTLLEAAGVDNLAALDAALDAARPGMTDRDVLAVALSHQQRGTAELITHFTCSVSSGPGWFPAGRPLREGDVIFIDQVFYGRGGYASDLTRTAFVGEPASPVAEAYRRLAEIAYEIYSACRPGVAVATLDAMMMEAFRRNGLGPAPYGLGHGIGLRVMEPPALIGADLTDAGHVLRLGETIAIEPETWIEHGGQRIPLKVEDCLVVEADGGRLLADPAPDDVHIIGT